MNARYSEDSTGRLLGIDAGNSFIKIALIEGERIRSIARMMSASSASVMQDKIENLSLERRLSGIGGVVLCSVVPSLTPHLRVFFKKSFSTRVLVVTNRLRLPFALAVKSPRMVGADRLCASAGALGPRRRSCIVIDLGSAMTVDLVSNGVFKGGFIMPGPEMSLSALSRHTGKLPRIRLDYRKSRRWLSISDTEGAMMSGVFTAAVSGVRGAVRELESREGKTLRKIISGGAYAWLCSGLPLSWEYDENLVFKGMRNIWHLNNSDLR